MQKHGVDLVPTDNWRKRVVESIVIGSYIINGKQFRYWYLPQKNPFPFQLPSLLPLSR